MDTQVDRKHHSTPNRKGGQERNKERKTERNSALHYSTIHMGMVGRGLCPSVGPHQGNCAAQEPPLPGPPYELQLQCSKQVRRLKTRCQCTGSVVEGWRRWIQTARSTSLSVQTARVSAPLRPLLYTPLQSLSEDGPRAGRTDNSTVRAGWQPNVQGNFPMCPLRVRQERARKRHGHRSRAYLAALATTATALFLALATKHVIETELELRAAGAGAGTQQGRSIPC